jgi:hypothetical protein
MIAARLYVAGDDEEEQARASALRVRPAARRDLEQDECDGSGMLRGIALGLLLSVAAWFWMALRLREALG